MNIQISRRDALLGSGALIVSFSLAGPSSAPCRRKRAAKPLALTEVDSFLAIDKAGNVTSIPARSNSAPVSPRRCARSWRKNSTCR